MNLHQSAADAIRQHAARSYPDECCGVLVGRIGPSLTVLEAVPVPNSSEANRSRHYTIDADTLRRITREADGRGLDVVGFYHSHPDHPAQPSQTDLREATFPYYAYVIQSVNRGKPGELTAWSLAEDRSSFLAREIKTVKPHSIAIESQ